MISPYRAPETFPKPGPDHPIVRWAALAAVLAALLVVGILCR